MGIKRKPTSWIVEIIKWENTFPELDPISDTYVLNKWCLFLLWYKLKPEHDRESKYKEILNAVLL